MPLEVVLAAGSVLSAAIVALWRKLDRVEARERELLRNWALQVQRGAQLYARAQRQPATPVPELPPPPDWDETTEFRTRREELEREALLREYVNSDPPPPRRR